MCVRRVFTYHGPRGRIIRGEASDSIAVLVNTPGTHTEVYQRAARLVKTVPVGPGRMSLKVSVKTAGFRIQGDRLLAAGVVVESTG